MVILVGLLLALFTAQRGFHITNSYQVAACAYRHEQLIQLAQGGMVYARALFEQKHALQDDLERYGQYQTEYRLPFQLDTKPGTIFFAIQYILLDSKNDVKIIVGVIIDEKHCYKLERVFQRKLLQVN